MKKNIFRALLFGLLASLMCGQWACATGDESYLVPDVTGRAHEVMVVMDKQQWDGALGDTIFGHFKQPILGLPRPEPMLDPVHISPGNFEQLANLHTFRTIIFVRSQPQAQPAIRIERDKWARGQFILHIQAPNQAALRQLVTDSLGAISQKILREESLRTAAKVAQNRHKTLSAQLEERYGFRISVPKQFALAQKYPDFLWLAYETREMSQGIFVYWFPYKSDQQLAKDSLVARRDAFLKRYVPAAIRGSYMATEHQLPLIYATGSTDGARMANLRGLWFTVNDFMGGPFVSRAVVDKARNRILVAEGFVYAPKSEQRNIIAYFDEVLKTVHPE